MDSREASRLYAQHASAMAYIDVEKPDGQRTIGTAFHIGEGVFLTARHVVAGNKIVEIKITEHVNVPTREWFGEVLKIDVTETFLQEYEEKLRPIFGQQPLFKRFLRPLEIVDGPHFPDDPNLDVAAFRVRSIHAAAGVTLLGVHWDDWIDRGFWHLSDAIVLGYPPIPMANEPLLVAARAEIHTFFLPRHVRYVHFLLSAMPRGGFSGGVAIHETGLGCTGCTLIGRCGGGKLGRAGCQIFQRGLGSAGVSYEPDERKQLLEHLRARRWRCRRVYRVQV
jgi:hypothetical protein